jgi:hypothetical protein
MTDIFTTPEITPEIDRYALMNADMVFIASCMLPPPERLRDSITAYLHAVAVGEATGGVYPSFEETHAAVVRSRAPREGTDD